jgi:dTDP-4-amino-4,6-dideoxygalactose transaminase
MTEIPLVDLRVQYVSIREEVKEAIDGVLEKSAFVLGEPVARFEEAFAAFCGVRHAVGVSSGTDALLYALKAAGISPGAEVITTPTTYIATAEAVALAGARVVFVDAEKTSANMNPDLLEEAVTEKTEAVIPVHLYGRPCDMDPIMKIAKDRGLKVIEDCCQAHGAVYKGRKVGTFGDAAAYSFYPAKNLGGFGDGGAVTTNDGELARLVRMLRDHGSPEKNIHHILGHTGRLHALQAAVLRVKLEHLPAWNSRRREAARIYDECLKDVRGIELLAPFSHGEHVYHLYVIRLPLRDEMGRRLKTEGIHTGIHYPVPIHLQKSFAHLGYGKGRFPVSEAHAAECLSLPLYPEIGESNIRAVCDALKRGISQ